MGWKDTMKEEDTMGKMALVAGFAAGALFGATAGRKKVNQLAESAKRSIDRPSMRDRWTKANRFVAEKAPTLHGVSGAIVDSVSSSGRTRRAGSVATGTR